MLLVAKILIDYNADPFLGNFQYNTTMDIITPKSKTSTAIFGYEYQPINIKKNRDEIRKYLEENSIHMVTKKYNL